MRASLFCHLDDIAAALDMAELRDRGLSALIANVVYHDWVCWAPMSRQAPLRREMGGASAVPVRANHPPALRPKERAAGSLTTLAAARDAGLAVDAWTVSLHRDDLGRTPAPDERLDRSAADLAFADAFGSRLSSWICPSSDEAAAYLDAHVADIQAMNFARLIVEGCHYPMLQHGGAHERDLSRLSPHVRCLLEICFCRACMDRMTSAGLDAETWRSDVAAAITAGSADALTDERLRITERLRRRRMSDLFRMLSSSKGGFDIVCADQPVIAGSVFRTGQRSDVDRREIHASVGLNLAALARAGIAIMSLAYFRSLSDIIEHVSHYLSEGIPADRLSVALRPGYPDNADANGLAEKVRAVHALGVRDIAFYELTQLTPEEWQFALKGIEVAAAA